MNHLIQFSTGVGSAEVAFRVCDEHLPENVTLITADTRVEDPDNWRFAHQVVNMLGPVQWTILADGRTPMQAGLDARVVPNNRMAGGLFRENLRDCGVTQAGFGRYLAQRCSLGSSGSNERIAGCRPIVDLH